MYATMYYFSTCVCMYMGIQSVACYSVFQYVFYLCKMNQNRWLMLCLLAVKNFRHEFQIIFCNILCTALIYITALQMCYWISSHSTNYYMHIAWAPLEELLYWPFINHDMLSSNSLTHWHCYLMESWYTMDQQKKHWIISLEMVSSL